jgi:hypothetical protein
MKHHFSFTRYRAVTKYAAACFLTGEGMRHRFGQAHDPAHFVYHYLGCTPVQVISHDSTADTFVVELASHPWDIKFKDNPATFETTIAAAAMKFE